MTLHHTSQQDLPSINSLWIGKNLGAISSACLKSFLEHGHKVNLYAYDDIVDLPDGITIHDANSIIDRSQIFRHHKRGSYAPFSDVFRYKMLKQIHHGIYVDCDVYCLKPIHMPSHGYLFGYENASIISNAVLALPTESELLNTLINLTSQKHFTPEWYSNYDKLRLNIKRLFGHANTLGKMGWGVTGPSAVTYYAKKTGEDQFAQPSTVFYPIQHHETQKLLDANIQINNIITDDCLCVHLYNETIRQKDLTKIDPNCILAKMLRNEI